MAGGHSVGIEADSLSAVVEGVGIPSVEVEEMQNQSAAAAVVEKKAWALEGLQTGSQSVVQ